MYVYIKLDLTTLTLSMLINIYIMICYVVNVMGILC